MVGIIESVAILGLQTLVLHVFYRRMERRLFPPSGPIDLSHLTPEERRRKAVFANRLGTGFYMLAWPVLTVAWLALFELAAYQGVPRGPAVAYVFVPMFGIAVLVAFVAGFALCGPAGVGMLRIALGRRYGESMVCGDSHFQLDIRRFMYVVFVWIIPFCVDWEIEHANCDTLFTTDAVIVKDFLAPRPIARPYRDIDRIDGAKDYRGNPAEVFAEPDFKISFKDEYDWVPIRWMHRTGGVAGILDAIAYASARSHNPIRWVARID